MGWKIFDPETDLEDEPYSDFTDDCIEDDIEPLLTEDEVPVLNFISYAISTEFFQRIIKCEGVTFKDIPDYENSEETLMIMFENYQAASSFYKKMSDPPNVFIEPAFSWYQPDHEELDTIPIKEEEDYSFGQTFDLAEYISMSENPDDLITLYKLRKILINFGSDMKKLILDTDLIRDCKSHFNALTILLNLIVKYCENVEEIILNGIEMKMKTDDEKRILTFQYSDNDDTDIFELDIKNGKLENPRECGYFQEYFNCSATAECLSFYFRNNRFMKVLDLRQNDNLTEQHIDEILEFQQNVTELFVEDRYENVEPEQLCKLFELRNLKLVSIENNDKCAHLIDDLLLKLSENLGGQLESLHLWNCSFSEQESLRGFDQLKRIIFTDTECLQDVGLIELANSGLLESVYIPECKLLTDEGLTELVRKNPQLKDLAIVGCEEITNDFIKNILDIVKLEHPDMGRTTSLYIDGNRTKINLKEWEGALDHLPAVPKVRLNWHNKLIDQIIISEI